jgi:hypothetical protein
VKAWPAGTCSFDAGAGDVVTGVSVVLDSKSVAVVSTPVVAGFEAVSPNWEGLAIFSSVTLYFEGLKLAMENTTCKRLIARIYQLRRRIYHHLLVRCSPRSVGEEWSKKEKGRRGRKRVWRDLENPRLR